MTNPPPSNTCPQCRAALPADAPQGLCPACLLAAVAEPTEAGTAPLPKAPPPTREQVVAAFPHLEILELIGVGGMGYVFKARQPKLDRLVALKLLPQHLGADAAFAGRFEREGRVLARLSHPNIVTVHDFGFARAGDLQSPPQPRAGDLQSPPSPATSDPDGDCKSPAPPLSTSQPGFYYLLMEFVDGVNLRQAMRAGRFTPVQALEVVPKICEALQFAHEQGILHRDIKPENILLDAKGRVKLVDFGIAKMLHSESNGDTPVPSARPRDGDTPVPDDSAGPTPFAAELGDKSVPPTTLTSATVALGTPSYMAPEQRDRPAEVDHRADIYSLGVVFYEMLTGELPVGKFAPPSAKSASDPRVDQVVLRALEQQRERRQQSAGEIRTQVENINATPRGNRREAVPPPHPLPADQAIEPPGQLGFFRRPLGWGVFLGALVTLVFVVVFAMVIGGTALSEWLKNSPLLSKQKPQPTAETKVAPTNAPALMARLREHYEQATHLVVEGHTVTTMLRTNQPAFVQANKFELKLGRPSLYQVRWTASPVGNHGHRGAVWSDGGTNWFWMNGSTPEARASRELTLGSGAGISQNVTGWLPTLFFGNASWVEVLGDLRLEPDAVIEGEPCAVLVGTARGNPTRLWISKRDFLLRQVEFLNIISAEFLARSPSDIPLGSTIRTVQTYRVVTGQTLTPSDFKFTPPGASK